MSGQRVGLGSGGHFLLGHLADVGLNQVGDDQVGRLIPLFNDPLLSIWIEGNVSPNIIIII